MASNQGHKRGQEQEQPLFRVAKRREPRLGGTPAKPQGQGDGRRVHSRPTTCAWHSRLQLTGAGVHTVCRHSHVHIQRVHALRASMLVEIATGGAGPWGGMRSACTMSCNWDARANRAEGGGKAACMYGEHHGMQGMVLCTNLATALATSRNGIDSCMPCDGQNRHCLGAQRPGAWQGGKRMAGRRGGHDAERDACTNTPSKIHDFSLNPVGQ
jgi:hypothetical protein